MILQIKTQGFPALINELGIQSPIQGPFWNFESTVMPMYIIGSSAIQKQVLGLPYPKANMLDTQFTDPGASAIMGQTPNLEAGIWAFQVSWTVNNQSTSVSNVLFKVRNIGGTVLRTTAMGAFPKAGQAGEVSAGIRDFVEEINEGDFIFVENLGAMVPADLRSSLKWVKLSNLSILPSP